ncbi:MAG: S8 family serine peptidase [Armatimonadota bacterium]|nr:S8 family serine peptidase [Armatimonadota bacterium]
MRIDSRKITIIALSLLIGLWAPLSAFAGGNGESRKIVVFDSTIVNEAAQDAILRGVGGVVIKPLPMLNGVAVILPETAVGALAGRSGVSRIDDDLVIYATGRTPPPQPAQTLPWGIQRVNAPAAWSISAGSGVKVAVIDTGIQLDHPDLAANIAGGYNAVNPTKAASDGNGHGTHVAGTVAAVNNSIGVAGVAPQARLYSVRVLNNAGTGFLSDIIEGLDWCRSQNIRVANMSLGSSGSNQSFHDAISLAYASGIVLVAAAGNNGGGYGTGTGQVDYPGAYPEVIAVSATDRNDRFAVFSSSGPAVDLAAPGVNVFSTYKGSGYATLNGTSMSTPHVTGAAAVRLALHPTETPEQVKAVLQSTAVDLGLPSEQQGAGLVDAYAAALAP